MTGKPNLEVSIPPHELRGTLVPPEPGCGIVLFAHGSGSSRLSPRNRFVADALQRIGLGTLLFDLLHPDEAADRRNVFDVGLLAGRLLAATDFLRGHPGLGAAALGYFGASTGAAAALAAQAEAGPSVGAIVSRGGRPDLAGAAVARVSAPTLLIVGSLDREVLALNESAFERLRCEKRLSIVPGASHLFEEPGTLERAVDLAQGWFADRIGGSRAVL